MTRPGATAGDSTLSPREFVDIALSNPVNAELLKRLPKLRLPQCYLVAGCLFQSMWNYLSKRPLGSAIKDYDIFYFDDCDLSFEAEDSVIRRAATLFADIGVEIEIKNQARVHLWYKAKFGAGYPALQSSCDGIDRYLIACTCVGIEAETGTLYAPDSLQDIATGMLRINPRNPQPTHFYAKATSYQSRWPWLTLIEPGA